MSQNSFIYESGALRNLVIEAPHAGNDVPEAFNKHEKLVRAAKKRIDNYTRETAFHLHEDLGGKLLIAKVSRLVVDLNRGVDRVDSRICPNWPHAAIHKDGGVIPHHICEENQWIRLYDKPLSENEVEERLTQCWYPYHEQLNHAIEQMIETFGSVILISLHSANPHEKHRFSNQATIYLGTQNGRTCDRLIQSNLRYELEKNKVHVVDADYYQGAFTTQAYGSNPAVQAIQFELDRQYLNEDLNISYCKTYLSAISQSLSAITLTTPPSENAKKYKMPSRSVYIDPLTGDVYPG